MLTLPLTQVTVVLSFILGLLSIISCLNIIQNYTKLRQNSHVIQKNITVTPNWRQATAGAIAIENMSESIGVGYRIIYQSRA